MQPTRAPFRLGQTCFLCCRDPFFLPAQPSQKRASFLSRKKFSAGTYSDHMALLRAFQVSCLSLIYCTSTSNIQNTQFTHHHHHHHHLALQPYMSLGLLCYLPPLVPILSFSSPFFNPHLLWVLLNVI